MINQTPINTQKSNNVYSTIKSLTLLNEHIPLVELIAERMVAVDANIKRENGKTNFSLLMRHLIVEKAQALDIVVEPMNIKDSE